MFAGKNSPGKTIVEGKNVNMRTLNSFSQCVATIITFSHIQNQRHKDIAKVRKFVPGDKVLVLLLTDHNKLLMQWKGPFEVSAVVGLNDNKVRVKGKDRVYHANLLKKYFEREDSVRWSSCC